MGNCRTCHQPIIFALVTNKQGRPPRAMPLDPEPRPDGNVAVHKDVTGRLVGRVIVAAKGQQPHGYEHLYMPHAATCASPCSSEPDAT